MNKTTIYAQLDGKLYKLIHIVIRNDNSIYVYFPRESGYIIKNKQNIELNGQKNKTFSFERNVKENIYSPYVSLHPGKGAIHINAQDGNGQQIHYVKDRDCAKLDEIVGSGEFTPFITIVIPPDMAYFDEAKKLNKHRLIINVPTGKPQSLALEILVHEKGGYIDKSDLPFERQRNIAFMAQLNEGLSKTLNYTLVLNNVRLDTEELATEVIVLVWNKLLPIGFCLTAPEAS